MKKHKVVVAVLALFAGCSLAACDGSFLSGSDRSSSGGKTWAGPHVIVNDAGYTQLSMNSKGDALVSWRHWDGFKETIHASRFGANDDLGDDVPVSTYSSISHRTAVGESGDCFIVWEDYNGGTTNIGSNHYAPRTGWGTEALAETNDMGDAIEPWVAPGPNGSAMAVWRQYYGSTFEVWANQYDASAGWNAPQLLKSISGGYTFFPTVAVDLFGNVIAVWIELKSYAYTIHAKRYEAGVGWDAVSTVIGSPDYPFEPHIAMDASGNAIVLWGEANNGSHGVQANRYETGKGWGTPEIIIELPDSVSYIYEPQIAVTPGGDAVVVWMQSDGSKYNIWADRYIAGTGWAKDPVLISDNVGNAQFPQVAIDPTSNAAAAWRQLNSGKENIWAAYYEAGTGWKAPRLISEDKEQVSAGYVNIAMDSDGNALAVWQEYDYNDRVSTIWANRLK